MRSPHSFWLGLTLRVRLLLIGLVGVAVALAVGAATLYGVLTLASYRTLDQAGRSAAADVAALVEAGRLPDPVPVTGNRLVQVVDPRDRVVGASVNGDRLTSLLLPSEVRRALTGSPVVVSGSRVGSPGRLRVVAQPARAPGASQADTVVVAQQFSDIEHSQRILRTTLLVTYPLLLVVLAGIAWRVIGAALRPVEELRSTADRISGSGQDERLPVPVSRDEIHALTLTLNSMLDRLAAGRERQRAFVADAAHELRSPLASMQAQLDVAQHLGEDVTREGELSEDLRAEVARMTRLVEDLLALARYDAGTLPAGGAERVDPSRLVAEVVDARRRLRVPVEVATTEQLAPPVVRVRPEDVCRALGNLVDNAVRHAATTVRVSTYLDPRGAGAPEVVIDVSDDGRGIAPQDRERVFERFTRLDEARDRDAGGSGLGLAIARELVVRNGGTVRLETSAAGGLSAQVRLPQA